MNIIIHEDVKEVLNELNEIGEAYIFGGYIRDRYLGFTPSDVDIVTNISIEKIERMYSSYEKAAKRVTVSGHNVFSFKLHRKEKIFVEIVSTNKELLMKPKEADYTLNSLLHDGKQVIDQTNGIKDLENGIIKEVDIEIVRHDLMERPYLWLKTLRLISMTDFDLSSETAKALNEKKTCIQQINPSIMQTEGYKVLNGKNPFKAMKLLANMEFMNKFYVSEKFHVKELSLQPHQKLCYYALLSSKETINEFISFFHLPNEIQQKFHELYESYHQEGYVPNRLRHQIKTIRKELEK